MKKITFFSLSVIAFFVMLNINLHSQQCEVRVTDITYESANSLTFDVYLKNFGLSDFVYSHGSLAWTIDPTFLNGGMPTFSLVPGYSDFSAGAQPPSALFTSPNILRTSSNMPGSNGTILPGQSLRLYRFRLQTSASSFASSNFSFSWKNSVVPYTRVYSWDSGTGLPGEVSSLEYSVQQLLFVEDFDYPAGDTLTNHGWIAHSGAGTQPITVNNGGLTYTGYTSSGIGNAALVDNNGEDINKVFSAQTSGTVYAAFMVRVDNYLTSGTGNYFFHFGQGDPINTSVFRGKVFAQKSGTTDLQFGLSFASNTPTLTAINYSIGTTYLVVLKYKIVSGIQNDSVSIFIFNGSIPANEPSVPTIGSLTETTGDLADVDAVALRQFNTSENIVVDGIRVGTSWLDILPTTGSPVISVIPSTLSGFSYTLGGGPSTSQSYSLSGTDLTPLSGSISVAGSTNYEVSTDNVNFSSGFSVGYNSGTLAATTIHIRLKSGLAGGVYNSENIANSGGGATTANVVCNGVVLKPEPTNHVTSFTGILGNPTYHFINLSWIDATGVSIPDGYLIKASNVSFASILDPVDGAAEVNSYFAQNVAQGLQACSFGLHSDSTYYFKIYSYTNSGTSINYKIDGSIPQFTITTAVPPSLPITENFEYTSGSALTVNGWVAHSGAGTNPILVNATPLSYTGYVNSGLGKSVSLLTSGEDDNRAFGSITSNSIYASFMVNVTSAQTAGEYFFHFAPENSTTLYFGKVFVKKNAGDSLAFGVSKNVNSATALYTPFSYSLNTTYLLVIKYTFNTGTTDDDEVKLWINPILNGTEPPSNLTQTDAGTDALSLGMFVLRQGAVANTPTLILGGLRVADTWVPGSSPTTFPLSVSVTNGWNMVSVPGLHPTNQNVLTWWPLKDPAANVFKFVPGTGYDTTTTVTPGKGYWLKNLGAYTYTYPAIQIVAHDPINGSAGWNMIGGYEQNVLTSGITTNPPGLINAIVYGYRSDSGYVRAYDIVRGKGYWIKLSASGQIIIPSLLAKGTSKIAITNTKEWGRIIITDNAGRSYTLYAVKGGVNLNDYELPPPAPAGMFDVRYSSGRYAEELSAANQIIEMNGMEYPVRVGVENANIRLQDETGKINERMKPGEEVVINSNMISKLLVSTDIIPDKYSLEQNYPNPFNPSTRIEFSIPEDVNNVTLTIYDALGQRVAELVNTKMEAGKYSYVWNASNVATGLYIYELRTDKFVSVKKMMLLK